MKERRNKVKRPPSLAPKLPVRDASSSTSSSEPTSAISEDVTPLSDVIHETIEIVETVAPVTKANARVNRSRKPKAPIPESDPVVKLTLYLSSADDEFLEQLRIAGLLANPRVDISRSAVVRAALQELRKLSTSEILTRVQMPTNTRRR